MGGDKDKVLPSDLVTLFVVMTALQTQIAEGAFFEPNANTGKLKTKPGMRKAMGLKKNTFKKKEVLYLNLERQLVRAMYSLKKVIKNGVPEMVCKEVPEGMIKSEDIPEDDVTLEFSDVLNSP